MYTINPKQTGATCYNRSLIRGRLLLFQECMAGCDKGNKLPQYFSQDKVKYASVLRCSCVTTLIGGHSIAQENF